ncbi:MAG TPA: ABC transporter substrate-binding protein [Gemmatimonadales bacterium]|nr:ABC transporter substrate-binding protein [Gemmatimonadales bacterium]
MKIVSLLPSATEIVCALGLEDALVGVSHSCDFPAGIMDRPRVTRTSVPTDASSAEIDAAVRATLARGESLYQLELECLDALAPDLLVTQSLCEVCAVGEGQVQAALHRLPGPPTVLTLSPETLDQVFDAIETVGRATGRAARATAVVAELRRRIAHVTWAIRNVTVRPRVAFLEWLDPPFSGGHWNPELVALAGGVDGLGTAGKPSRRLSWAEVVAWQPEVLCVACCGYDADRTRAELAALLAAPESAALAALPCFTAGRVHVFDGVGHFSRPGPRLVESLELLARALHPERFAASASNPELPTSA